jgi:ABC-type lipoprotein release transport system permease subunit
MAAPELAAEARRLRAALGRRRGTVALAVLAVAIGASVASALLHVYADLGARLTRELRARGPNLLVVPAAVSDTGAGRFIAEAALRARLAEAGVTGVPILYADAVLDGRRVAVVGADLAAARRLHPGWRVFGGPRPADPDLSMMGARLMDRLRVAPGATLTLRPTGAGDGVTVEVGARLEAGGADDEAFWLPLVRAQAVSGLSGRVSLARARLEGGAERLPSTIAALERDGTMRALPLHALSAGEGRRLERLRPQVALIAGAVFAAAGLGALGALTGLALERRPEIASLKARGATRGDLARLIAAESLGIGAAGGALGWLIGVGFAQAIGRRVFQSPVALHWEVAPLVIGLAIGVTLLAGLGPLRMALGVAPAPGGR